MVGTADMGGIVAAIRSGAVMKQIKTKCKIDRPTRVQAGISTRHVQSGKESNKC